MVSLLVHAAAIVEMPQIRLPRLDRSEQAENEGRLTVRLAPPFAVSPDRSAPPAPRARLRPTPPVVAVEQPAPAPAPSVTAPAPPVFAGDLMAYVEARRLARGDPAEPRDAPRERPAEDEKSRANRIATANLDTQRQMTFGFDPSRSGGVFAIERLRDDYAEFTFVGWNPEARRRTKQLIEVRKGSDSDIRIAVVRKMISIIRTLEPEEFTWQSQRLGRSVTLSSRMRDNTGLEDFMMAEFFEVKR